MAGTVSHGLARLEGTNVLSPSDREGALGHHLAALLARDHDTLRDLPAIVDDAAARGALTFTEGSAAHSTIDR